MLQLTVEKQVLRILLVNSEKGCKKKKIKIRRSNIIWKTAETKKFKARESVYGESYVLMYFGTSYYIFFQMCGSCRRTKITWVLLCFSHKNTRCTIDREVSVMPTILCLVGTKYSIGHNCLMMSVPAVQV